MLQFEPSDFFHSQQSESSQGLPLSEIEESVVND